MLVLPIEFVKTYAHYKPKVGRSIYLQGSDIILDGDVGMHRSVFYDQGENPSPDSFTGPEEIDEYIEWARANRRLITAAKLIAVGPDYDPWTEEDWCECFEHLIDAFDFSVPYDLSALYGGEFPYAVSLPCDLAVPRNLP